MKQCVNTSGSGRLLPRFPGLVRRTRAALEVPEGGRFCGAPHVLRVGADGAQQPVVSVHLGRASAQEGVVWRIRLLATHHAEGGSTVHVTALLALPGGVLPDRELNELSGDTWPRCPRSEPNELSKTN